MSGARKLDLGLPRSFLCTAFKYQRNVSYNCLMNSISSFRARAKQLKQQTLTVYYAARDRRTPLHVRALAFLVAAYALSPIDLIPDFIPVLGYLDDVILVPLGLALVVKLTPPEVLASAQSQAKVAASKPVSYTAAAFIVLLWLAVLWVVVRWAIGVWRG